MHDNNYLLEKCYTLANCLEIYINCSQDINTATAMLNEVNDRITNLEIEIKE